MWWYKRKLWRCEFNCISSYIFALVYATHLLAQIEKCCVVRGSVYKPIQRALLIISNSTSSNSSLYPLSFVMYNKTGSGVLKVNVHGWYNRNILKLSCITYRGINVLMFGSMVQGFMAAIIMTIITVPYIYVIGAHLKIKYGWSIFICVVKP